MKPSRNQLKRIALTLLLTSCIVIFVSCSRLGFQEMGPAKSPVTEKTFHAPAEAVGTIQNPKVSESSGMAASHCADDVLWTHNDSGDANLIFALDPTGRDLGTYIVDGSSNRDWEDIASFRDKDGDCFLLIGDIGNNHMKRSERIVYKVREPKLDTDRKPNPVPGLTGRAEIIKFTYGQETFDAETLMVHPGSGDIYVVTKSLSGAAKVFRVGNVNDTKADGVAVEVGEIATPSLPAGLFTGGDISPDGTRVIVTDYFYGYELRLDSPSESFDEIWKKPMTRVDLGSRRQGESVCYSKDGTRLFAGSERSGSALNMVVLSED